MKDLLVVLAVAVTGAIGYLIAGATGAAWKPGSGLPPVAFPRMTTRISGRRSRDRSQGLRLLLQREGFEVIGEAANGQERSARR